MKAENISDALMFLEDDIIEETESIRNRKKNYKVIWLRCLSAAACLCIALVAVFSAMPQFNLPLRGGNTNNSSWAGTKGESQPVDEYKYGGALGSVPGSMDLPDDGVYLEIKEWKRNCFYALVLSAKSEDLPNGMMVKVKFSKDIMYADQPSWNGLGDSFYEDGIPNEKIFPVGCKVYVTFDKMWNSFFNSKAQKVIKANCVYFYKGEVPLRGPDGFNRVTYYVEITNWGHKEFEGIIKGSDGNAGELPIGKEVSFKFDENIRVKKRGGKFENFIPTEEDFPVGCRVEVFANDYDAPKFLGTSEMWIYSISDLNRHQTLLVRIDKWNDKGFTGEISGENGQQALYYTNHTAIVEFTDNTRTESHKKWGTTTISLAPTEEDFPVGTTVEVSYYKSVQKSINETVYTAERIWLFEQG